MPIASMTGYGYGQFESDEATFTCEIRSLNNRFLEANVRLPRHLLGIEPALQKIVKAELARGKVDTFFDIALKNPGDQLPTVVPSAIDHYLKQFQIIGERAQTGGYNLTEVRLTELLRLDGVTDQSSQIGKRRNQVEKYEAGLSHALRAAIDNLKEARQKEGEALASALTAILDKIESDLTDLVKDLPDLRNLLRDQMTKRLQSTLEQISELMQQSGNQVPQDRLAAELAVMGDKIDIEEELTRLQTHIDEFRKTLTIDEPIGRKLDFLCQEMHREINTMGNKMVHQTASKRTMNMKQLNEQIRQQVQNIE